MVFALGFSLELGVIVLLVILLLFGGSKIPQLMRGMGQGMGEFKKGLNESKQPDPVTEDPQKPAV
jgi:sec-independent protein translocase protein TatA